jgi:hypothetical protein
MKASTAFFEKKAAKKNLLRFARVWHRSRHIEPTEFFLLLFPRPDDGAALTAPSESGRLFAQKRRLFS